MRRKTKNFIHTYGLCFIAVCVMVVLAIPLNGFAEGENSEVHKIQPPPEFDTDEMDMADIVKKRFDAHGPIDFINEDRIVIGDVAHEIASEASISISEGDYAGIQFNAWGQVVAAERLQGPPE